MGTAKKYQLFEDNAESLNLNSSKDSITTPGYQSMNRTSMALAFLTLSSFRKLASLDSPGAQVPLASTIPLNERTAVAAPVWYGNRASSPET